MSTLTRSRPSKPKATAAREAPRPPDRAIAKTRIVVRDVRWEVYDVLSDSIREGAPVRMAYDGKDMEIMTTSGIHDFFSEGIRVFVHEVSTTMSISTLCVGRATWKRPDLARGIEADNSFYFLSEKISVVGAALKRRSMDIADYPNPDLAIEIDISAPKVDREEIYEKLKVAEIWYLDGEDVTIKQLGDDGQYAVAEWSRFLPVKAAEIQRWLVQEDSTDQLAWSLRLRAWLRRIARTRRPAAKPRPRRRKADG